MKYQRPPLSLFAPEPSLVEQSPPEVVAGNGRRLKPTVAFNSYWHVAAERQAMLFRRLRGDAILTHDPILRNHRFTNAYRAADRVSQYFIHAIALRPSVDPIDTIFRTLLFKIFNRIETWEALEAQLGEPIAWKTFSFARYDTALAAVLASQPLYSNAYMMPNPPFGYPAKQNNHLELIRTILTSGLTERILKAQTLQDVYTEFKAVPSFGPFLAFQYTIDLNYTDLLNFDESEFVVAGPGALDGIRKCFTDVAGYSSADVIKIMAEIADQQFADRDLPFISLWGRRLQLIDCQNLFCEVDKYSRVAHPQLTDAGGRGRIKQRYTQSKGRLLPYAFPRRWTITTSPSFGNPEKLHFS